LRTWIVSVAALAMQLVPCDAAKRQLHAILRYTGPVVDLERKDGSVVADGRLPAPRVTLRNPHYLQGTKADTRNARGEGSWGEKAQLNIRTANCSCKFLGFGNGNFLALNHLLPPCRIFLLKVTVRTPTQPSQIRSNYLLPRKTPQVADWLCPSTFIGYCVAVASLKATARTMRGVAFCSVVILTIVAAEAFDLRLMWDYAARSPAAHFEVGLARGD
jgi:hypothetical protein